jgi:hypothetical protein
MTGMSRCVVPYKLTGSKHLCTVSTRLHGATSQKTDIFLLAAVKALILTSIVTLVTSRIQYAESAAPMKEKIRFQVLTAASMMFRAVFWVILPCKMIVD